MCDGYEARFFSRRLQNTFALMTADAGRRAILGGAGKADGGRRNQRESVDWLQIDVRDKAPS